MGTFEKVNAAFDVNWTTVLVPYPDSTVTQSYSTGFGSGKDVTRHEKWSRVQKVTDSSSIDAEGMMVLEHGVEVSSSGSGESDERTSSDGWTYEEFSDGRVMQDDSSSRIDTRHDDYTYSTSAGDLNATGTANWNRTWNYEDHGLMGDQLDEGTESDSQPISGAMCGRRYSADTTGPGTASFAGAGSMGGAWTLDTTPDTVEGGDGEGDGGVGPNADTGEGNGGADNSDMPELWPAEEPGYWRRFCQYVAEFDNALIRISIGVPIGITNNIANANRIDVRIPVPQYYMDEAASPDWREHVRNWETGIGLTAGLAGLFEGALAGAAKISTAEAGLAAKNFLGANAVIKRNTSKSLVVQSADGTRQIRLDLQGHGDLPHAHIQVLDSKSGRFVDAPGLPHRLPFRP